MMKLGFTVKTPILLISISFLLAIIFMLIALPPWLNYLRPQLVVLTLLYWVLYMPQRVGMLVAWCLGMMLDILYNVTLGVHALMFVIVVFIALKWQVRFNFFAFWQKTAFIFILVFISLVPPFYLEIIARNNLSWWLCGISPFISALIWPYLVYLLDMARQKFHMV